MISNEYELIIDFITYFSDFFTTEILNTKSLNFLEKEKKINFYILRPLISLISYPIIDRSVRLLKLIDNHKKIDDLEINNYSLNDYFISRADFYSCNGPIQVHHLLKPSDGKRGWSLKAGDNQVIPLCMYHHAHLHTKFGNEFKFLKFYGFKKISYLLP